MGIFGGTEDNQPYVYLFLLSTLVCAFGSCCCRPCGVTSFHSNKGSPLSPAYPVVLLYFLSDLKCFKKPGNQLIWVLPHRSWLSLCDAQNKFISGWCALWLSGPDCPFIISYCKSKVSRWHVLLHKFSFFCRMTPASWQMFPLS